jgi:hypothetical protein
LKVVVERMAVVVPPEVFNQKVKGSVKQNPSPLPTGTIRFGRSSYSKRVGKRCRLFTLPNLNKFIF